MLVNKLLDNINIDTRHYGFGAAFNDTTNHLANSIKEGLHYVPTLLDGEH